VLANCPLQGLIGLLVKGLLIKDRNAYLKGFGGTASAACYSTGVTGSWAQRCCCISLLAACADRQHV
jgi:hypothetical protein